MSHLCLFPQPDPFVNTESVSIQRVKFLDQIFCYKLAYFVNFIYENLPTVKEELDYNSQKV